MLFISKSDRVGYIRTGAGAKVGLSDRNARAIIKSMGKYFKAGRFDEGMVGGAILIQEVLSGDREEVGSEKLGWFERLFEYIFWAVFILIALFAILGPWLVYAFQILTIVALYPVAWSMDKATLAWRKFCSSEQDRQPDNERKEEGIR
jgi:uncharacterized membrane protein YgcG